MVISYSGTEYSDMLSGTIVIELKKYVLSISIASRF